MIAMLAMICRALLATLRYACYAVRCAAMRALLCCLRNAPRCVLRLLCYAAPALSTIR